MYGGYTILGEVTPQALVEAVAQYMKQGWVPLGAPFVAPRQKGSRLDMHPKRPEAAWLQAMVLPMTVVAAQEPAAAQGPGRQALGPEEYAAAGAPPGQREP